MEAFLENYNAERYEEIFNNFSIEMKQSLPLEATRHFFTNLRNQAGRIKSKEFVEFQQETYASYKTKFEKNILSVNISINKENQINGFFIKPFEDSTISINNIINSLNVYPKAISEIIYPTIKNVPNNTQLSIAIIQGGKTSFYGVIKTNDSIKPIDNQSEIFEIGSITKVFTSTVLASLVEKKKIRLTDKINGYYSFPFKNNVIISFESLSNHTSGLPRLPGNLDLHNDVNPYKDYGKKDIEYYLKNLVKLKKDSSELYAYSNLGAGLLGYTLGLSQKTSYQELLQKDVFDKYKMTHSYVNANNIKGKLVIGQDADGKPTKNWDWDILLGAGGILSCTEDLVKFTIAQFNSNNKELALTRIPTFVVNQNMKIGLGWHLLNTASNKEIIWHNGGTGGYSSSIAINTNEKSAVIILSNLSGFYPKMDTIDNLCFDILNKIENKD